MVHTRRRPYQLYQRQNFLEARAKHMRKLICKRYGANYTAHRTWWPYLVYHVLKMHPKFCESPKKFRANNSATASVSIMLSSSFLF